MPSPPVPPWVVVEHGDAPIVLLAPHGGRRRAVRVPGEHKVNDLHTADVTRALARALDASAIINEHVDRNELDLNRTSQVRRDAPWLLELLADMLRVKVAASGRAMVLVIHGWNVSQVACDVGIGMRDDGHGVCLPVRPDSATVSAAFVDQRLRPLQDAAAAQGITVTIGSRYPAAHPNNLLQLFRRDGGDGGGHDGVPCPLAVLLRTASVEAVQLELAIPLRWPGRRRDAFVAMLATTFASEHRPMAPSAATPPVRLRTAGGRIRGRRGLQFVVDDCLVMTSIEAGAEGPIGGRLVLSESPSELGLFTGELVPTSGEWWVPPLRWEGRPDGTLNVTYEGPLVRFASHTPFLDLERGLAGGTLVEARLDAWFEPIDLPTETGAPERMGRVHGELVVDGRLRRIATRGVATVVDPPAMPRAPRGCITLPAASAGSILLTIESLEIDGAPDRYRAALSGRFWNDRDHVSLLAEATIELGANDGTLLVSCPDLALTVPARLERVIPVLRPGPNQTIVRTTFALVRAAGEAIGWLEMSVLGAAPMLVSAD